MEPRQKLKKSGHGVYICKYHLVWCTKYRYRVMDGKIRYYVRDVIRQLCEWKKLEIIQGNVQLDHIHLLVEIPPSTAVSQAVGFLKGRSAIKIFNKFGTLKQKRYWGHHFWPKGYCATTVGLNKEQIKAYVRWQHKKDQQVESQTRLL